MHTDIEKFKSFCCREKGKVPLHLLSDCEKIYRLYDGIDEFNDSFNSDYQFLNLCYGVVAIAKKQHGDDLESITKMALEILSEEYEQDDIWQLFIANVLAMGKNEHLKRDPLIKSLKRQELDELVRIEQMEKAS